MNRIHQLIFSLMLMLVALNSGTSLNAQSEYEPSETNPYGLLNPEAPAQIKDYQDMIGLCHCKSSRMGNDKKWSDPVDMTWEFKYIMNGTAVQDQTLKDDGIHSGSIRQYNNEDKEWHVYYYSTSSVPETLQTWKGNKKDNTITLYSEQKAPNGMDGFYKIMFYDITKDGFNWLGQWVSPDESVSFPLWKIDCLKVRE